MNRNTVATRLSQLLIAIKNCEEAKPGNTLWAIRHGETITDIVKEYMPHGGGFDRGTTLLESSTPERLVFHTSFHHMDDNGGYNGWTEHRVVVKASLAFGLSIMVAGRDHLKGGSIKDFIYQAFESALTQESRL